MKILESKFQNNLSHIFKVFLARKARYRNHFFFVQYSSSQNHVVFVMFFNDVIKQYYQIAHCKEVTNLDIFQQTEYETRNQE